MKILIGADIVPTKETEELFIAGNPRDLFGDICDVVKQADRTVVNLECALTTSDNAIKKFGPALKADPKCVETLKNLGVTDVMLANNHVFDYGIQGLRDTVDALERVGLPYTGIGENDTDSRKPYIVEQDGKKVGFINVCEHEFSYALPNRVGANPYNPYLTMRDIRALKGQVDYVVVLYHGGKELCSYPSPRLRLLCQEMVENGANAVITQHSHCIGCYEEYKGAHIVYGQGNFHFSWGKMKEIWYESLLVELDFDQGVAIKFYPFTSHEKCLTLAKGEAYDKVMHAFETRNKELQNGEWKKGWKAFCETASERYIKIANRENSHDWFAHYLDCEAHTDVWRELFPTWNATNELPPANPTQKDKA